MSKKVLVVDDDANLLAGIRRQLRRVYDLTTVQGGEEALALLDTKETFAVLVCDMRMPGVDGLDVLRAFKQRSPDTVRMMLTGNADQQTAIDAINEGAIFRFFTKPCSTELLCAGIDGALEQHRLITAERELLEKTLSGSIRVLSGVLSVHDPYSFGRAQKMRNWVRMIVRALNLKSRWQLEVATMLAPLGMISVPPEMMAKVQARKELTAAETYILDQTPGAARELIIHIPRLATVADVVYLQNKHFDGTGYPFDDKRSGEDIPLDARILHILIELTKLCSGPVPTVAALDQLADRPNHFDGRIVQAIRTALTQKGNQALSDQPQDELGQPVKYVRVVIDDLEAGDHLRSDLRMANGHLVLGKGLQLSAAQVSRIRNLGKLHKMLEPVEVMRPLGDA